jgi:DNA-binding NtrC family response regulator
MKPTILIADDDLHICEALEMEFRERGYDRIHKALTPGGALKHLEATTVDMAIVDLNFTPEGREGFQLIEDIRKKYPATRIAVLTVVENLPDVVEAMNRGADDYLTKQIQFDIGSQIKLAIDRAVAEIERRHLKALQEYIDRRPPDELVGMSENIKRIKQQVERAHANGVRHFNVVGATGTGKYQVCQYVYSRDSDEKKRNRPLLRFNCGDTTVEMARSELFGIAPNSGLPNTERRGRPGVFQIARSGYVLLDDFQEFPAELYGALLHVLDVHQVKPVGGSRYDEVDFKLMVTSQKALDEFPRQIKERLDHQSVTLRIDPLDTRQEDVVPLAEHFLNGFSRKLGVKAFEQEVLENFSKLSFPGNVRQLKNIVWQLALAESQDVITMDTFFNYFRSEEVPSGSLLAEHIETAEVSAIREALAQSDGSVDESAAALGIHPLALRRRAKKLDIPVGREWQRRKEDPT